MKVAACAVTSFGDDDVDSPFDVGVIAMNWCSDIAVADGAGEVISKAPLDGNTVVDFGGVLLCDRWDNFGAVSEG